MAKYKVLKRFRDLEKEETYDAGQEIDITKKRAKEIETKLKGYLEEVQEKPKKETKGKSKKKKGD